MSNPELPKPIKRAMRSLWTLGSTPSSWLIASTNFIMDLNGRSTFVIRAAFRCHFSSAGQLTKA
jgi:hypothetical protein